MFESIIMAGFLTTSSFVKDYNIVFSRSSRVNTIWSSKVNYVCINPEFNFSIITENLVRNFRNRTKLYNLNNLNLYKNKGDCDENKISDHIYILNYTK